MNMRYLSILTGGWRTLDASDAFLPALDEMIFSPSDFSLSTKLSTSFPLTPSFSALLDPLGLQKEQDRLTSVCLCIKIYHSPRLQLIPDWSRSHFRLLWLYCISEDGGWCDAAHSWISKTSEAWHFLSGAFSILSCSLQLFSLAFHLSICFSFLGLLQSIIERNRKCFELVQ